MTMYTAQPVPTVKTVNVDIITTNSLRILKNFYQRDSSIEWDKFH